MKSKNKEIQKYFEIYDKCHKKCHSEKIINMVNDVAEYDKINQLCKIDCISIIYSKLYNEQFTK